IQDLYLDGKKDEAAAAIPDALLDALSLCGDEGYVRERIQAFRDSGVTNLNINPVGPDPVGLTAKIKEWAS
ncbi:MAG: LLM class flavin-dependent oxidoreductase, partial [Acidimicrobiales bacterium]|nr:LLM class flavin-dependent oxidoreductase [Acidimicrobiales bacterium]